eukprot:COSAG06_NODE_26313_length_617_cov_1.061776_1_plen_62_part_01
MAVCDTGHLAKCPVSQTAVSPTAGHLAASQRGHSSAWPVRRPERERRESGWLSADVQGVGLL